MYQKAISLVRQSIFPVFMMKSDNQNTSITVTGSAFFINNNGCFLTANHVMNPLLESGISPVYFGNLPLSTTGQPVFIEEIYRSAERDIFLGRIPSSYFPGLKLNYNRQLDGTSVILSGYPLPVIGLNNQGGFELGNVRQYWQPTIIVDQFENMQLPNGNYNAYMTQHAAINGMSGGPVFNLNGEVIGMSVGTSNRKVPQNAGEMRLDNGIAIKIFSTKDVIEMAG